MTFKQEAEESIRFYDDLRHTDEDKQYLDSEIRILKFILDDLNNRESCKCSDIATGIGRKALFIGIVLVAITVFSGIFAMGTYTSYIFKATGSNMTPNMSAIVVGVIQLVGSMCATQLVDRLGRKVPFCS